MRISEVDLYRYELPLAPPLCLGASTVEHRHGLLVRLETEQGAVGWGEAAPLPGFSEETLSEVIDAARRRAPRWIGAEIPDGEKDLPRSFLALPMRSACSASLRFAIESAVLELLAATRNTSVPDVLGTARSTVALNALLTSLDDGPEQAARFREQGYRAVKVKVGRADMGEEINALQAIRRDLGDAIALRADANRAWSLDEAEAFAEATRDLQLAYVEEPLTDPTQISELTSQTDLPVALDETTREVEPSILRESPSVAAVVLKPTLLGGIQTTQTWSRIALEHGATPVISASYESGIGMRMLVALAAVGPDTSVGLSTYTRLAADVQRPPLQMNGPEVYVESIVDAPISINEDRIERIDTFPS